MSELSQADRMIKMLEKAGSKGVANYEFSNRRIIRYNARITDLRQSGHNIYAERQKLRNGRSTGVWRYYLLKDEA